MFYETIKEVNDFYPEFVEYFLTVDFSGNIKTSTGPASHSKDLSKQYKNMNYKDKRQLHTFINYSNKNISINGLVQPPKIVSNVKSNIAPH